MTSKIILGDEMDKAETSFGIDAAPFKPKAQEGSRYMIRAVVANAQQFPRNVEMLGREFANAFGGFTSYETTGGWVDEKSGKYMVEHGLCFEVSFSASDKQTETLLEHARALIARLGHEIGERWVHIELHGFRAYHTQTNA